MASKFGNTWWGAAWLNSLSNIDYENRIPRGAAYARKGAVSTLKIKDNIIEAKVQGTRRTPYKVMIVLPKFQKEEIDRLVDRLLMKPALISGLFQRQLSPDVAEIASECGLKLFPERWSDLKMNCNCPDWAVPCKHLASVIYMLSREIDNNPFLVFEMHGVHLIEELQNRGINLTDKASQTQPIATSQLLSKSKSQKADKDVQTSCQKVVSMDFTKLKSLSEANAILLPDQPPFYVYGNFKEIYLGQLKRVASGALRYIDGKLFAEALFPTNAQLPLVTADSRVSFVVNDNLVWKTMLSDFESAVDVEANAMFQSILAIDPDRVTDYHDSIICLHKALFAAIHFTANNLIKPEIVKLPGGEYAVVWQPLQSDATVCEMLDSLDCTMPQEMVKGSFKGLKKDVLLDNKAQLLISSIVTELVHILSLSKDDNHICQLFFKGSRYKFAGIGETEIPGSIRAWSDRLTVSETQWTPVIYVEDKSENQDCFSMTINISSLGTDMYGECPLSEILASGRWQRHRFDVLQSVMRLTNAIPGLNEYINQGAVSPIVFDDVQFVDFIINVIPAMRMLGLKVYLPKSLSHLLKPKASLKIFDKEMEPGMFSIYDFFTYDWRIAIGDEVIDLKTFEGMLKNAQGLIRFKKSYFYVSPDDMEKLMSRIRSQKTLSPIELFQAALSEEFDSAPVEMSEGVKAKMAEIKSYAEVNVPTDLNAQLRPYQQRGFSWLYRNMKVGFGSILADDMGLGKTLQAITLMLKIKEDNGFGKSKALVVAPVGLLYNWEAEIKRFAPTLKTFIYHGIGRNIKDSKDADVVITSYGMARSDASKIKKGDWKLLIIDEAQNIKNPKTEQAKAVNSIDAPCKIALSGTPVENRLSEFWSIMQFTNKGYLGSLKEFTNDFVKPIQIFNDASCADELKKITAPFLMRRMKTDKSIISDLPDKIERDLYASLTPHQAALYEQTLQEAMAIIEGMPTDTQQALFKRQGIILQMILALKQICDHPALFLKNGSEEASISGKAQLLLDRVHSIVDANDKVLIFTQYREMGHILQRIIKENVGQTPLFYHGGCSVKERTEMVNKFQNSRQNQIFILSLKAAGTGLNLTAANNVIHYDLWWNPAVESQATDRAYRIGQKRNVLVDRFITTGTFEERINDMINSKRHLAEMTVATGETWIGNLSNKELHELFDR